MYLLKVSRVLNLLARKPRLLSVAALNLRGRLSYPFAKRQINGRSAPPEQITVMVTDVCNFRCPMCQYVYSDAPGFRLNRTGHMHPHVYRKLTDETPGWPLIAFGGGEPLLHPQISEFIAQAHARGRPTWLTTNGWSLADRAQELCEAGLDFLVVSVDGPAEIHDRIRSSTAFARLTEGLNAILPLPKRPLVFVNMAISDINHDQLLKLYELAVKWRVDGIDYNHLWMHTDEMVKAFNARFASFFTADEVAWNVRPDRVDFQQVTDALAAIKRINWKNRLIVTTNPPLNRQEIEIWYRQPEKFVKWTTTRCAWNRMRVWPDGSVQGCRGWTVGNITQEHAMDIWNGARMRGFRRLLADQGMFPICSRCCDLAHR